MTQKSELRLAPMTGALVKEVALLEQICFPDPWSMAMLQAELEEPNAAWLVALENKRVIGYIGLHTAADEGEIVNIAVSPGSRRKGVGAALLETVLDFAAFQGIGRIFLEVRESNAAAQALYEAAGFAPVGRRKDYYSLPKEDALVMEKAVEPC